MYEEQRARILKLAENKPKDYWRDKAEIPLGSKNTFEDYEEGIIPDNNIITLKVDTRGAQERNPFNCLVAAATGVGKTRLMKNIIKGYWKQGYKILIFEPKSTEMMNAKKIGRGERIHHLDMNEKLPIVSYCPNFIKAYIEKNSTYLLGKVKFYSPSIEKLDYIEIWQSLGLPAKIASLLVDLINRGVNTLEKFEKKIMVTNMNHMTRTAVETTFASMKALQFFGTTKKLDLEKEWEENNIVVVNYLSRDGAMMNTDVGLVLDVVRDIGMKEASQGLDNVSKKLIIFDDAFYYAGISAAAAARFSGMNLAIRNIANCQNNFRTWGIDTIFTVQSPDSNAIHTALIDGCTTKLVSYVENPMALQNKLPFGAFQLLANTKPDMPQLYVDEENYTFQWILVKGKTQWTTFFPFDVTVGHQ
jgi:hypothetical protein